MFRRAGIPSLVAALLSAFSVVVAAQVFPLGLLPSPPSSDQPLRAFVWTEQSVVSIGEDVTIFIRANRPAFLYLFDLQPDGIVRLVFPNAYSAQNYVAGTRELPDGAYRLIAQPPAGIDELLVVASDVPLPFPTPSPVDPFPLVAASPEGAIRELVSLLNALSPEWAIGWHAFQIVGGSSGSPREVETEITLSAPPPRPLFSGLPGDSWYAEGGGWYPGIPASGWYWHFGVDSRWHLCLVTGAE